MRIEVSQTPGYEINLANLDDLDVKVRCSQTSCDYYRCRWCLREDFPSGCVASGFAWVHNPICYDDE